MRRDRERPRPRGRPLDLGVEEEPEQRDALLRRGPRAAAPDGVRSGSKGSRRRSGGKEEVPFFFFFFFVLATFSSSSPSSSTNHLPSPTSAASSAAAETCSSASCGVQRPYHAGGPSNHSSEARSARWARSLALEARTFEEGEGEGEEEEEEFIEERQLPCAAADALLSSDRASSSASLASLALAPPEAGCCVRCLAFSRARWSSLESRERMACASAETAAVKLAGEEGGGRGDDDEDAAEDDDDDDETTAVAPTTEPPLTPPPSAQTLNHSSLQYSSHAACALTPLVSSGWSSGSPPGDMWKASASISVDLENRPACASWVELHPAATAAARGTLRLGAAAATHAQAMVETRTATGVSLRAGAAPRARMAAARAGLGGGGWSCWGGRG